MIDPAFNFLRNADVKPAAADLLNRLSVRDRELVRELLELMGRSAQKHSIPIVRTELVAHRDPEEDTDKLEIRQWVRLPHEMVMAHWEKMGREIDRWVNALPEPDADAIMEWVAFAVYSDVNDAAA